MGPRDMQRRDFLRMAAAAGAAGGIGGALPGGLLLPREGLAAPVWPSLQDAEIVLGNGEPPAMQFQAYPGGTGALLEKLWRDSGESPFTRRPLDVEPWEGPLPASEEDLAFLPVHRLSALVRAGRVSPTELTEVYLERLKRYDPVLLCAVTILEGRAREEA
ncbi:MAG: twin-arginine translocation signal domain-containing protein, partial [Gemmatimonadetes bacterium]|nr:twin-arginine translocation signal domain-containing protein [Gemmatimonadota bacterium]